MRSVKTKAVLLGTILSTEQRSTVMLYRRWKTAQERDQRVVEHDVDMQAIQALRLVESGLPKTRVWKMLSLSGVANLERLLERGRSALARLEKDEGW